MERLPIEIVKHIISFDKRFIIRHGKIIQINQIVKNDKRRDLLAGIKTINYNANDNSSYVYLNINSHKSLYIMYFDYKLEILTLWCDEKGNEEIVE
jgi:hypothetical protein